MATDLESGQQEGEVVPVRPSLKITRLHIKGLKSIGSLDLPEDGLGWNGEIPDFVMVGGINGSGKTTLLEFLAGVFEFFSQRASIPDAVGPQELPDQLCVTEARVDINFSISGGFEEDFRFLIGEKSYLEQNSCDTWFGFEYMMSHPSRRGFLRQKVQANALSRLDSVFRIWSEHDYKSPLVVYFPSEGRSLVIPETTYKQPGDLSPLDNFVQRWQRPVEWRDSTPALMYASRWEDLNAKEEGRPEDAKHFIAYLLAFDRFFQGRKRLKWTAKGRLVVETKNGDIHDLSQLSSGEKQVILFMGELLHRWRPGSLILIDEPELHLHQSYQTKLWEALVDWQKERGGQVILATQSGHLFKIAETAMKVLLSRRSR